MKEHKGGGGWEGGEGLAPTLPGPLPSAPLQRPLEGLLIGFWLAPSFQLIDTAMGGTQVCSEWSGLHTTSWVTVRNPSHGPTVWVPPFMDEETGSERRGGHSPVAEPMWAQLGCNPRSSDYKSERRQSDHVAVYTVRRAATLITGTTATKQARGPRDRTHSVPPCS